MKKLILLALIPAFLMGCKNSKEESERTDTQQAGEDTSDIKESTLIQVGQDVPEFSFETIDGNTYKISELDGNIVLINFFATWCPSCMEEMPALQEQVWEKYKDKEDFFMVSIGREHDMSEMKEFNEENDYTFKFAPDTGRVVYSKFAEKYIPRNVVVDKEGKIIYQCTGYKEEEFKQMLKILKERLQ
ncbi:MAG: TlpA disulfide reductase family protein [Bacteroidales bacterium]